MVTQDVERATDECIDGCDSLKHEFGDTMRGFSDDDRDRINAALLEAGQLLFAQYGLERTRIKDVTDEVDIGTSTFYQFFDSKEALYVEVLLLEHDQFHAAIENSVEDVDDHREQVRTTLETMFEEIESNPLIYRLIVEGELRSLQTRLSGGERATLIDGVRGAELSQVDDWVANPACNADDPAVVNSALNFIVFVSRVKDVRTERTERPEYDVVREFLIDLVVEGLFSESDA